MPSWGQILKELKLNQQNTGNPDYDGVRRKYLAKLHLHTKRAVILYATDFTSGRILPADLTSMHNGDMQGFMEVLHGITDTKLDLILHSPGGSAEAVDSFVSYLRTKFDDIRVFIPHLAMSAATMLACGADSIVMGKHSFIGPIDPQLVFSTKDGTTIAPAQAILDQFELAKKNIKTPQDAVFWLPLLAQYGPALLIQCQNARDLAVELVTQWLTKYMLKNINNPAPRAQQIAETLSDHSKFKSHSRVINREESRKLGLQIENLENDPELQDIVLSIFHATTHTFQGSGAAKIIENH